MDVTQVFNSSLELGRIISGVTTDVTGSLTITFALFTLVLILIAGFFKMPEVLYVIPLLPILIMFSVADSGTKMFLGVIALFLGYVFYSVVNVR